jgi:hypothetical protein
MPAAQIDTLLDIWAASLLRSGGDPLFNNHKEMYRTIDNIKIGEIKWRNFSVRYTSVRPPADVPPWMEDTYKVYYRDPHEVVRSIIANPDFAAELTYGPYREYLTETDERRWCDFMSGDWAWNQAASIFSILSFLSQRVVVSKVFRTGHYCARRSLARRCTCADHPRE